MPKQSEADSATYDSHCKTVGHATHRPISASVGLAKDTFLMPVQAAGSLYIRQTSGVHWSPHKGSVEASEQH